MRERKERGVGKVGQRHGHTRYQRDDRAMNFGVGVTVHLYWKPIMTGKRR